MGKSSKFVEDGRFEGHFEKVSIVTKLVKKKKKTFPAFYVLEKDLTTHPTTHVARIFP